MFEFDTAHHHNIAVKRKKRLLVLMALDSPTDLYDNDASDTVVLRQYLRQYTYVDYRAGDWLDKLLYALPLHGMDQQLEDQEQGNFENHEAMLLQWVYADSLFDRTIESCSWKNPERTTIVITSYQLPAHLRTLETIGPFKTALKTYLHSIQ